MRDNGGRIALMKLELIEPEMFFRMHLAAADARAGEVGALLASDSPPP